MFSSSTTLRTAITGAPSISLVYLDLAQGLKAFTAIDRAVTMQVGDVLPVGINTDLAKF